MQKIYNLIQIWKLQKIQKFMDDLDQIKDDEEEVEGDLDDDILPSKKPKGPKDIDEVSLDELAEEDDEVLPEDRFDDVEPEDLW